MPGIVLCGCGLLFLDGPSKMKNSWKRRQAIRKPELETTIAHPAEMEEQD
jgi:hypothetical protein